MTQLTNNSLLLYQDKLIVIAKRSFAPIFKCHGVAHSQLQLITMGLNYPKVSRGAFGSNDSPISATFKKQQMTEILIKALDTFGINNQTNQTIEELAELIVAINKWKRHGSLENMIEEIADVEIMILQLKMYFQFALEVQEKKKEKIERLKNILRK